MKNNRREFLTHALTLGTVAALPFSGHTFPADDAPALPSLKGRKILFVYGGWPGHEPDKYFDYMTSWFKSEGADVQSFNSLDPYADPALMGNVDLIVQVFTQGKLTKEQEQGLLTAVENGAGMAGWHGGMCDAFRENTEYQFMTGGQWVVHPGGVIDYEVKITDHNDEITKGLKDFKMKSEQYYMLIDPNIKVLATTRFSAGTKPEGDKPWQRMYPWIEGAVIPVTWKKMHGKGRIFYTSVGHNVSHITEVPDAIEMVKRGVRWASASKYEPAEKWLNPMYGK